MLSGFGRPGAIDMNFWDQRYAEPGFKYGTQANAFLVSQAARLKPGSDVLVPGDGEGRNGVWLAQQGHHVTSTDGSQVGMAKAQALAAERGVPLRTEVTDFAAWTPAPASADAVVLTFVHMPSALRRAVHRKLAAALRPGGVLVLEAFQPAQLGRPSGGPQDADMLQTLAALREDFAGLLDEQLGWEGEDTLDEGQGHRGPALLTRYIGVKRA